MIFTRWELQAAINRANNNGCVDLDYLRDFLPPSLAGSAPKINFGRRKNRPSGAESAILLCKLGSGGDYVKEIWGVK